MGNPSRTADEVRAKNLRERTIEDLDAMLEIADRADRAAAARAGADPPPYSAQAPSEKGASSIRSSTTTQTSRAALNKLDFSPSPLELPSPAECIAHLKLLHAFAKLRHDIGNKDGLYGISFNLDKFEDAQKTIATPADVSLRHDSHQPEGVHGQTGSAPVLSEEAKVASTLAEGIREKRWAIFVTKAVQRFEKWWDTLPSTSKTYNTPIRTTDFEPSYGEPPTSFPTVGEGLGENMKNLLPPLDVLMVWHSFILNPRVYFEDCIRLSRHKLWRSSFPWKLIHEAIDSETFEYNPSDMCSSAFEKSTKLQWYAENENDNNRNVLQCPRCRSRVIVPWTRVPASPSISVIATYLTEDTGYAGKYFSDYCPSCDLFITHETLRVAKFITDAEAVNSFKRPLPGTILNSLGLPQMTTTSKKLGTHDPFFPNRVVTTLSDFQPQALRQEIASLTIEILKQRFQQTMTTDWKLKIANSEQFKPETVAKESKIAVRKMFSHYWDNSSSFSIDLVGAVIRQGGFVQKMKKINWLQSPAVLTTMQRLIVKYHRFVRIIAGNPNKIAVPTLDVDLAWHTHQLSPKIYYSYSLAETKKFLNHDDKIPETSLHSNFQWTSNAYEKKYGTPYSECACWYCECTREPLRSGFSNRVFRSIKDYDVDRLQERGLTQDPTVGAHVSSHNAVVNTRPMVATTGVPETFAQQRRRELEELDLQYAKVRKRYQKKKKAGEAPNRENDAYIYGAYGYPMYYPVYVPYYAEPTCENDRYSSTGGGGGGGCGSCASGTCAASASMGGCSGGDGTPSCAASCGGHGDASGGCGSCGGDGGGDGGGCGGCGG